MPLLPVRIHYIVGYQLRQRQSQYSVLSNRKNKLNQYCSRIMKAETQCLKVFNQKIGLFNRVISVISVILRETTLTVSDSTGEPVSLESEMVRLFSR